MQNSILSYCRIKNKQLHVNGQLIVASTEAEDLSAFLSHAYKTTALNYPKFFKMDKLCKLGVLATEVLIRHTPDFGTLPTNNMALVFSNKSSSMDTDRNHAQTIADKTNYFPSPSVFVYTLPNIVIGEIAIKHKIQGENAFFISEKFDAELMYTYIELLLNSENCSSVIGGWVEVDGSSAEAFVYCVKKGNFSGEIKQLQTIHNSTNLQHLYSL